MRLHQVTGPNTVKAHERTNSLPIDAIHATFISADFAALLLVFDALKIPLPNSDVSWEEGWLMDKM